MVEIRSFHRVFDLERRIYRIDRLRLNPSGIPVRGVVYFLALLLGALLFHALPPFGVVLSWIPWYLWDLAAPAGGATLLAVVRIDGRPAHLVAWALLRYVVEPGCVSRLEPCEPVGARWCPPPLTILPDGSEGRMRRLRYRGRGSVRISRPHALLVPGRSQRAWHGLIGRRGSGLLIVREAPVDMAGRYRTIVLRKGAQLEVRPGSGEGHRGVPVQVGEPAGTGRESWHA